MVQVVDIQNEPNLIFLKHAETVQGGKVDRLHWARQANAVIILAQSPGFQP